MKTPHRTWIPLFLAALALAGSAAASTPDTLSGGSVYPLKLPVDSSGYVIYVNEEPIVRIDSEWKAGGPLTSDLEMSLAGQNVTASLKIEVDSAGLWTVIHLLSSRGDATVTREGGRLLIAGGGQKRSVDLKPGTLLFENSTPCLMSQAVAAYDQTKAGTQTFPVFIIPAIVMDVALERLETVERFVGGEPTSFTIYRYGLGGVDITLWVDTAGRVCLADVPSQRAAYVREGYEGLRLVPETDSLVSKPEHGVEVDRDVMVRMRDGKRLATDIYRPSGTGPFPVILLRTPYSKEMQELKARFYARRGYVFVAQDCRGRFKSEGKWNPFFAEPADGYDTIEWLAAQAWSSGKVGMIGGSYLGWVQWWAASESPPHLATIVPNVAPPDPWFNIPYEYGSFFLLGAIWWADVLEREATADLSGKAMADIYGKNYWKLLRGLPVVDLDKKVLGKKNRYWREWIDHPNNDAYWDKVSFLPRLGGADIPAYHQSGWFDGDAIGSKLNYLAMRRFGHGGQKLVLGPWGHTDAATRRGPNDRDFGPNAIVDLEGSFLRWLDRWLKGTENGIDTKDALVSLFVMNANRWLTGPEYPLPGTRFAKLHLQSSGSANTSKGNGWLSFDPPISGTAPYDTFVYDPGDPTPDPNFYVTERDTSEAAKRDTTKILSTEAEIERAYAYYGAVDERRADILVYDTEPMTDSLVIAGPVSAVLYASSTAKDTDWFMRLSEIDERGRVFPLVHGTIRARFRESQSKPSLLEPGKVYEYRLDLWQTGIMIPKGRSLRVEVASASFPTFSRNLNTGGRNEKEKKFVAAVQRIYHDEAHPSHVLLPVIDNPSFVDRPW